MTAPRAYYFATLLQDGRVLIASGRGTDGDLASAELYDPSTGTFTATESMTTSGRYYLNTATLLRDGRVLMTEGSGAELYDPASGTFTVTGNPPFFFERATLLTDGRVLGVRVVDAALYDPATGSFAPTGGPTTYEYGQAILLANGKVLVAGGNDDPGPSHIAELHDPSSGTFAATGNMTTPRSSLTITRLPDGKALIAGGGTWSDPVLSQGGYVFVLPAQNCTIQKLACLPPPAAWLHAVPAILPRYSRPVRFW